VVASVGKVLKTLDAVDATNLIDEVYGCELCPSSQFGFIRRPNGNGYYKFPATIGAAGEAMLLFIGINPRRSENNLRLHRELAEHRESFRILAGNRVPYNGKAGGPRYISPRAEEKHYRPHAKVVTAVFGDGAYFEDHAAVTELFLCASENARRLPRLGKSPCADCYLGRVVQQVMPEVIIAVGVMPRDYLVAWSVGHGDGVWRVEIAGHQAWAVYLPHPRFGVPQAEIERVAAQIRRIRSGTMPPWRQPAPFETAQPAELGPLRGARAASVPADNPTVAYSRDTSSTPPSAKIVGRWWARVLDRNVTQTRQMRTLAPVLAAHPDAIELIAELLSDLTVWKLIRIANVEYNKLRPNQMPDNPDPVARSRAAWELLDHHVRTIEMKGSGTDWARTAELLEEGSQPALAYLQTLPIRHVITACENLIRYPYRAV
jgi:hypothetical protein